MFVLCWDGVVEEAGLEGIMGESVQVVDESRLGGF